MAETKYNVEIKFNNKKWQYVSQNSSLEWAIKLVNKPYYKMHGPRRIRKVVKTVVWTSPKDEK